MSRIYKHFSFFKTSDFYIFTNFNKNFFSHNLSNVIYYDYFFFLSNFVVDKTFFKLFKSFSNSLFFYLNKNFNFLCLDLNYKNNFFKYISFSDFDLIKYNYFFDFSLKFLKKQEFFYSYCFFLKKKKVKFIIVFDYKYYYNFLTYFNLLNCAIFSFVPLKMNSSYVDFFIPYISSFNFLLKPIFYSYFLFSLNTVYNNRNFNLKKLFFV